jgi:hypothetical protein
MGGVTPYWQSRRNPKNESLKPLQFGNINNNDWYVSGLTLTYTLREKMCRLRKWTY